MNSQNKAMLSQNHHSLPETNIYRPHAVGSFPTDYRYTLFESDECTGSDSSLVECDNRPRILLMGLRRSGKSSIHKVVFHKMSPNETIFLESTNRIMKDDINNSSFVQFQIWDFPGQIDFFDPAFDSDVIFKGCDALVFVIDAHDDYVEALTKLNKTIMKAVQVNKAIKFEVFIHKVDGINDDLKMETQRDIHQRATDDLADSGFSYINISFHLTSIYDYSIFEAFSKVVQRLIPQLPKLENLLNIFIMLISSRTLKMYRPTSSLVACKSANDNNIRTKKIHINSGIEKAFLFDVVSKIYVATDSSPVDMQSYELCCDMIDVVIDLSSIYSSEFRASFDEQSGSVIRLNNGIVLYLREINKYLALVSILRDYNFLRQGIIDYNFMCFHEAIHKIFSVKLPKKYDISNNNNNFNDSEDYENEDDDVNHVDNSDDAQSCDMNQSNSRLAKYLLSVRFAKDMEN